MKYLVQKLLYHNGQDLRIGDEIELDDDNLANLLLSDGTIAYIQADTKKSSAKSVKSDAAPS
jgi:hypothetical protein